MHMQPQQSNFSFRVSEDTSSYNSVLFRYISLLWSPLSNEGQTFETHVYATDGLDIFSIGQ